MLLSVGCCWLVLVCRCLLFGVCRRALVVARCSLFVVGWLFDVVVCLFVCSCSLFAIGVCLLFVVCMLLVVGSW